MNKVYRLKFSKSQNQSVVVSEIAKGQDHKSGNSSKGLLAVGAFLLSALSFFTNTVHATPTGSTVVNGSATIEQQGNVMTITNTDKTIINWDDFSIRQHEIVNFVQPATSSVLNRVTGRSISEINGIISSSGNVFVINPNGIIFGANSIVNANSFIASTLDITNENFKNENYVFNEKRRSIVSVINNGAITVNGNGKLALLGSNVENSGTLKSANGDIHLMAGKSITIYDSRDPRISYVVNTDSRSVNLGQIFTKGGKVNLAAFHVDNAGSIETNGGTVKLRSSSLSKISGTINISNTEGNVGEIYAYSSQTVHVTPTAILNANSVNQQGGNIRLLGQVLNNLEEQASLVAGNLVFLGADSSTTKVDGNVTVQGDILIKGLNISTTNKSNVNSANGALTLVGNADTAEMNLNGSLAAKGNINLRAVDMYVSGNILSGANITIAAQNNITTNSSITLVRTLADKVTYRHDSELFVTKFKAADNVNITGRNMTVYSSVETENGDINIGNNDTNTINSEVTLSMKLNAANDFNIVADDINFNAFEITAGNNVTAKGVSRTLVKGRITAGNNIDLGTNTSNTTVAAIGRFSGDNGITLLGEDITKFSITELNSSNGSVNIGNENTNNANLPGFFMLGPMGAIKAHDDINITAKNINVSADLYAGKNVRLVGKDNTTVTRKITSEKTVINAGNDIYIGRDDTNLTTVEAQLTANNTVYLKGKEVIEVEQSRNDEITARLILDKLETTNNVYALNTGVIENGVITLQNFTDVGFYDLDQIESTLAGNKVSYYIVDNANFDSIKFNLDNHDLTKEEFLKVMKKHMKKSGSANVNAPLQYSGRIDKKICFSKVLVSAEDSKTGKPVILQECLERP